MNQPDTDQHQELVRQFQRAEDDPDVPKIYFNGFLNVLGAGDLTLVLKRGETPVAVITMSHTVAKTLYDKLGGAIGQFETKTDQNVLTTEEIAAKLSEQK